VGSFSVRMLRWTPLGIAGRWGNAGRGSFVASWSYFSVRKRSRIFRGTRGNSFRNLPSLEFSLLS